MGVSSAAHVAPSSAVKEGHVPRRPKVLQAIQRAHFEGFAAIYERQYARRYGRFRLERITEAVTEFLRCGDYRFGVARLKCSNPSCGRELFRPLSCKTFRVEPGGCPPGTPTDPYVRFSRIRFLWVIASLCRQSVRSAVVAGDKC